MAVRRVLVISMCILAAIAGRTSSGSVWSLFASSSETAYIFSSFDTCSVSQAAASKGAVEGTGIGGVTGATGAVGAGGISGSMGVEEGKG